MERLIEIASLQCVFHWQIKRHHCGK